MKFSHSIVIVVLFLLPVPSRSADRYSVLAIPSSLLPAPSVVRNDSIQFEIIDIRRSVLKVVHAVTIFSKEEQSKGNLVLWYNKYGSIEELNGMLYDAEGKIIRELEDEDVKDYSAVDNYTLYDDSRVRYAELIHNVFPYTVEYSYEIEYDGSLSWPRWTAQTDENPVEHTSFEVLTPKNYSLRYWCNNDTVTPERKEIKNQILYRWRQDGLQKLAKESVNGGMDEATTIVRIAPVDFQMENTTGSMSSWKEFGKWYYQLTKDRLKLPEDAVVDVNTITATTVPRREQIKKLYEYMQSKTRYVSVQLGIGGWQPFDAGYVHQRGYGDCKALTNYMEALLAQAGITSYPVLINSGTDYYSMITRFPSNQFNHVILCVPGEKDSLWLECTSRSMPFGMLRYSTEHRSALLITPEGGEVVQTPESTSEDNLQQRSASVMLTASGTASAVITTSMKGQRQVETQHALINATPKEREEWVLGQMEMSNIVLSSYAFHGIESHSPEISLEISAQLSRYASATGSRIFFHPSLIARRTSIPPPAEKRVSPYRFSYPYRNVDSLYFRIPENFMVETLPSETNLQTSFGSFRAKTIQLGDSAVVYTRMTDIRTYAIPAAGYVEYRAFVADIVKADRSQVVLKRK